MSTFRSALFPSGLFLFLVAAVFFCFGSVTAQPLSRVVSIPRSVESVLDATSPDWRPSGPPVVPCADVLPVHVIGGEDFVGLSQDALSIVSELTGFSFVLVDSSESPYITLESKSAFSEFERRLPGYEESKSLGYTRHANRWSSGQAVADFVLISVLDVPGVTSYAFSHDGLGVTLVHEIGHALGIGHTDEAGNVMSASADGVEFLTATDRQLFAAAAARCVS